MKNRLLLETIAKAIGYEQSWVEKPESNGQNTLLWTKDRNGDIFEWDPEHSNGDIFRLCLMFNIKIEIHKDTQTVSATFVKPIGNPSRLPDQVACRYDEKDIMGSARKVALRAAYELSKLKLEYKDREIELLC